MKLWKIFLAPLLFVHILAAAGPGDGGGGGGAYVCRKPDGSMESRLVDLWESERTSFKGRSVHVVYSDQDAEQQFQNAMKKLEGVSPEFANAVKKEKNELFKNAIALSNDEAIPLPDDLKTTRAPKNCPPTGMMYYDGDARHLKVDEEIFRALRTKTDVAAAWAHEAIYKVLRDQMHQKDSKLTRRLVGCLFSDDKYCLNPQFPTLQAGRLAFHCKNPNLNVTLIPSRTEVVIFDVSEDRTDPKIVKQNEPMIVEIHGMQGLDLRFNVNNLQNLGKIDDSNRPMGPLSDYGYAPNARVRAELLGEGKIAITEYSHSLNGSAGFSSSWKSLGSNKIMCRPIWGKSDGSTVLNGKYKTEYSRNISPAMEEDSPTDESGTVDAR